MDLISILKVVEQHNAKQLFKWCRHFCCVNYQPLKKRDDWKELKGQNLEYIEENQWPPKKYWEELAKYEKELAAAKKDEDNGSNNNEDGAQKKKCVIM